LNPVAVEDGYAFEGEFLPFRPCRERLDVVAVRLSRLHGLPPRTVLGVLLTKLEGLIQKEACTQRACEQYGETCPMSLNALSCSS